MFGKKNTVERNAFDNNLEVLRNEYFKAWDELKEQVEKVYVKNLAISIYPNGVDKNKAIKDSALAQEHLLTLIGHFDDVRRKYMEFLNNYRENLNLYKEAYSQKMDFITSHEIVEKTLKNLLTNK